MTNRASPTWKIVLEVSALIILVAALGVLLWTTAARKEVTVRQNISQPQQDSTPQPDTQVEEKPSLTLTADKIVTITTDKIEYMQGEEIKASLSYDRIIYAWGYDEITYAWSIQKWENGSWVTIIRRGDPYFICAPTPQCKDIDFSRIESCPPTVSCPKPCWYQVQGTPEVTWDQSYKVEERTFQCKTGKIERVITLPCVMFSQALPGRYKIRFQYALAIDPSNPCSRDVGIRYAEKEIAIRK